MMSEQDIQIIRTRMIDYVNSQNWDIVIKAKTCMAINGFVIHSLKERNTIKDCVDCLYKKACILVRKRALVDQKAKIRDFVNIKIINEKDCMKKDKYQEQILEHHSAIEAYELILKFIERV